MHAQAPADPLSNARTEAQLPELSRTDSGLRILHSAVLAVALHFVLGILTILVLLELVLGLVHRRAPHPRLQAFGAGLTSYVASILRYLTFNAQTPPFPFSDLSDA